MASPEDLKEIEKRIEKGTLSISDLDDLQVLEDKLLASDRISRNAAESWMIIFYTMLANEKRASPQFRLAKILFAS